MAIELCFVMHKRLPSCEARQTSLRKIKQSEIYLDKIAKHDTDGMVVAYLRPLGNFTARTTRINGQHVFVKTSAAKNVSGISFKTSLITSVPHIIRYPLKR